jgi:hypothetical protein
MDEKEDPVVGAGGANKPPVPNDPDNRSPLPEPKRTDEDGLPESAPDSDRDGGGSHV